MTYYRIDISGWSLTGTNNAMEFYKQRKAHLKITDVLWLIRDVEIDPYYIDCTYHLRTPVLVYLN